MLRTIKLPFLQCYRSDGKLYFYVRKKGRPRVRIRAPLGTQEFHAEYAAALDTQAERQARHAAGTLGRLVADYYLSAEFVNLKPNTQILYRSTLEPVVIAYGNRPRAMPREAALNIIRAIGATRKGRANVTVAVLHRIYELARISPNPFHGIARYKIGTHHTWTEPELAMFESRWPPGTLERRVYELLLATDQRVGDVARMQVADIRNGLIHVVQEKTGAELWLPIATRGLPKAGYLVTDAKGQPTTGKKLSEFFKRAAREAGLPDRCTAHGVRKAMLRRLAESGATTKEMAAMSGHKSLRELERYSAAADQAKMAAEARKKVSRKFAS